MSKTNKTEQLGMNASTASHILVKDILWNFIKITGNNVCCHCNTEMTRDSFSIEHLKPWLNSDNPKELYFDLNNISFSHLTCNIKYKKIKTQPCGTRAAYKRGCRCKDCSKIATEYAASFYTSEKRRSRYKKTGC